MTTNKSLRVIFLLAISVCAVTAELPGKKMTVSYSSIDAPSANWYIAFASLTNFRSVKAKISTTGMV